MPAGGRGRRRLLRAAEHAVQRGVRQVLGAASAFLHGSPASRAGLRPPNIGPQLRALQTAAIGCSRCTVRAWSRSGTSSAARRRCSRRASTSPRSGSTTRSSPPRRSTTTRESASPIARSRSAIRPRRTSIARPRWYCLKSGHPLPALVCARVLEAHGADASDLTAALVVHYGSESELLGKVAARIALPADDAAVAVPDVRAAGAARCGRGRARSAPSTRPTTFKDFPEAVHPIPLLSTLSEAAFRRVLGTLVLRRLPGGALVIREGEPGNSFFFVAGGAAPRVRDRRARPPDRARAARRGRGVRRDGAAVGAAAHRRASRARPRSICSRSAGSRSRRSPTSSARSPRRCTGSRASACSAT